MTTEARSKVCAACGRDFAWRRKWARCWSQVRYCSERCRRTRLRRFDLALEDAIRELLRERNGTICPSQAVRLVVSGDWKSGMEAARAAARRMAARNEIAVLQRGRRVDPSRARGPIRLGRGSAFPRTAG